MKDVRLKKNKVSIVKRGHPWIFSGALAQDQDLPESGSVIRVVDEQGNFLALGHYQDASIAVRILSYQDIKIDVGFFIQRFKEALRLREMLVISKDTNAYRLINGEGDLLGGLIIDVYDDCVVMECHSQGMFRQRALIAEAIEELSIPVSTIFVQRPDILRKDEEESFEAYLKGDSPEKVIKENGLKFLINWETGQKTGFFLDQRDNRSLVQHLAKGKKVLNLFSYTGGFSIYAAEAGASEVTSVDISKKATEQLKLNLSLNHQKEETHTVLTENVKDYLNKDDKFDLIIVDPPAFAKNIKKRHNAVQAYKRLNTNVLKMIRPGGYLMTFSCSQVVEPELFYNTITSSFIESKRSGQTLKKLSQGMDHPVLTRHEVGHYLKGLLMRVT